VDGLEFESVEEADFDGAKIGMGLERGTKGFLTSATLERGRFFRGIVNMVGPRTLRLGGQ